MARLSWRICLFSVMSVALIVAGGLLWHQARYLPLHRLTALEYPALLDSGSKESLLAAARSQLDVVNRLPAGQPVSFGSEQYTPKILQESLQDFINLVEQGVSGEALARHLKRNYTVYQAGGRQSSWFRRMLVTGYYEPVFPGCLKQTEDCQIPLYRPPSDLVRRKSADGSVQVGRYTTTGELVDYWSRKEIETQGLLAGQELAWMQDPYDAFLLHVQGSGRLRLPDGRVQGVRFAATNGLEYQSIGRLFVQEHLLPKEDVSAAAMRDYLQNNPAQIQRILFHNPRYVFFSLAADDSGPKGSSGVVLTPERSIALDSRVLPPGTLAFLITRKPILGEDGKISGWEQMTRFVFPQDSGAAIQGTGRVDIFWGNGEYAEVAAGTMKEPGKLYFLVKSKHVPSS